MLAWIVSSAARPRDVWGLIDAERPAKRRLVDVQLRSHLDCLLAMDEFHTLQETVLSVEQTEIDMGPNANLPAGERRTLGALAALEERMPGKVAAAVGPRFSAIDEDTLDQSYYHGLDSVAKQRFHTTSWFGSQKVDWKAVREYRKRSEASHRSLMAAGEVEKRRRLLLGAPTSSATALTTSSPPSSSTALTTSSPCAASTAPVITTPPAAPTPTAPSSARTPAMSALERENDTLRAQMATSSACGAIVERAQMTVRGVPQLMDVYVDNVAPKEREGSGWRSEKMVGKQEARRVGHLINDVYNPVAFAVMQRHLDEHMALNDAVAAVEALRNPADWKFIKGLPDWKKDRKEDAARYLSKLLDKDFWEAYKAATASSAPPSAPPAAEPPAAEVATSTIAPVPGSTTRILGLDPSTSCGWSLVHLDGSKVVAIHCGVFDVKALETAGARCNALATQVRQLLDPLPTHAYLETYVFNPSTPKDAAINYKLRAALEMALDSSGVALHEVAPQTWKRAIAGDGKAEKQKVKAAIEKRKCTFPMHLPINGRMLTLRDDASDAVAIALYGAQQQHSLEHVGPITIEAPQLGALRKRAGDAAPTPRKRSKAVARAGTSM